MSIPQIPRQTQSMIAYRLWLSTSENPSKETHCGNVVNMPYCYHQIIIHAILRVDVRHQQNLMSLSVAPRKVIFSANTQVSRTTKNYKLASNARNNELTLVKAGLSSEGLKRHLFLRLCSSTAISSEPQNWVLVVASSVMLQNILSSSISFSTPSFCMFSRQHMNSCKSKEAQSFNYVSRPCKCFRYICQCYKYACHANPDQYFDLRTLTGQIHGEEKWLKSPSCPVFSGELVVQFNQP